MATLFHPAAMYAMANSIPDIQIRMWRGDMASAAEVEDKAGSIDAFRAEVDPDAFYSERELVALYVETYPPATSPALDRKVARNRRLRDRQDAALARMEASLVEAPQPEHTLDGWFDARLVARLAAAGVTTFAELLALMRARRQRWYRAVPRLGAIGAQRIDGRESTRASLSRSRWRRVVRLLCSPAARI